MRFMVHPIPGRNDLVPMFGTVIDRREVTFKVKRSVIETEFWAASSIEVTLTNRLGMAMHMLVGVRPCCRRLRSMQQNAFANLN